MAILAVAATAAQAAPKIIEGLKSLTGGSRPRAGGADPCGFCNGVEVFRGVVVKNANLDGAPPDFRDLPPCNDGLIPCGGGKEVEGIGLVAPFANKDDALDCVVLPWRDKFFRLDPCSLSWVPVAAEKNPFTGVSGTVQTAGGAIQEAFGEAKEKGVSVLSIVIIAGVGFLAAKFLL